MRNLVLLLLLLVTAPAAFAQHDHNHAASPYVDYLDRPIKALSQAEVGDLLEGNGMGFALPAELNGYPGPRHVIELAHGLGLTQEQVGEVRAVFDRMNISARRLGERLVTQETELDDAFSTGTIGEKRLLDLTEGIARTRGAIRATHLLAHLEMMRVLTAEQVATYNQLRGYTDSSMNH